MELTQHSSPWAGCQSEAATPARAASQVRLGVRGLAPAKERSLRERRPNPAPPDFPRPALRERRPNPAPPDFPRPALRGRRQKPAPFEAESGRY
nr:MAG TPA: hypothetical protein [Inoviridae sp.]